MTKPWDRRNDETSPAWQAFVAYRDAGTDRTIKATTAATGKATATHRQHEAWSSKHDWVSRARAWDVHVDQAVQKRLLKDRTERAVQQAALGRNMAAVAGMGLSRLTEEVRDPKAPGGKRLDLRADLKPSEIAQLGKTGVEIQRLAEGDPTGRLQHEGVPDGVPIPVRVLRFDASKFPSPGTEEK